MSSEQGVMSSEQGVMSSEQGVMSSEQGSVSSEQCVMSSEQGSVSGGLTVWFLQRARSRPEASRRHRLFAVFYVGLL